MAKLNLNSVLETFILAAGTPPSVWRTVPDHTTVATQPKARMKEMTLKDRVRIVGVLQCMTPTQEGNRDE